MPEHCPRLLKYLFFSQNPFQRFQIPSNYTMTSSVLDASFNLPTPKYLKWILSLKHYYYPLRPITIISESIIMCLKKPQYLFSAFRSQINSISKDKPLLIILFQIRSCPIPKYFKIEHLLCFLHITYSSLNVCMYASISLLFIFYNFSNTINSMVIEIMLIFSSLYFWHLRHGLANHEGSINIYI